VQQHLERTLQNPLPNRATCFRTTLLFAIAMLLMPSGFAIAIPIDPAKADFESKLGEVSEDQQGCRTVKLSLGDRLNGELLEIKWSILNSTGHDLNLPRSTSSCGCIKGVPSGLAIENERTKTFGFQLVVPKEQGPSSKQLAFFDTAGICRIRLDIELNAVSPFLIQDTIPLDQEGRQLVSVPIRSQSKDHHLDRHDLSVEGMGVLGSRWIKDQEGDLSRVELDIDTIAMGSNSVSKVVFEFTSKDQGTVLSKVERSFWMKNRPFTKPKIVALGRKSNAWVGDFRLFVGEVNGPVTNMDVSNIKITNPGGAKVSSVPTIEVHAVDQKDMVAGLDCTIRLEDKSNELHPGAVVTLSFSLKGRDIQVKCLATR